MTQPSLDKYPGYYPAGSKPFWSRTKVGLAAGIVGLVVGIAGGGSEAESPPVADDSSAIADLQADLDQAVEAKADLAEQLSEQRQDAAADAEAATKAAQRSQKKAVKAAVTKTRREEQKKAAAAVQAAKEEAATSPTGIAPLASTQPATDPRFSYCYEANAAGYGPYYQGQDPEYDWYDDRDGDGIVCER